MSELLTSKEGSLPVSKALHGLEPPLSAPERAMGCAGVSNSLSFPVKILSWSPLWSSGDLSTWFYFRMCLTNSEGIYAPLSAPDWLHFLFQLSQHKIKSASRFLHPVTCAHQAYCCQWVAENWELGDSGWAEHDSFPWFTWLLMSSKTSVLL